ncbi:hypothetical protein [Saccharophagus sp. K07]|uniref:hypothetical protein n=1 Tax=Saccharophagus sp. K07 TaxID=2283636 RepID=UPI00351C0F19
MPLCHRHQIRTSCIPDFSASRHWKIDATKQYPLSLYPKRFWHCYSGFVRGCHFAAVLLRRRMFHQNWSC